MEIYALMSPKINQTEGMPPSKPPITIQAGLMCSLDLFYFELPILAQVLFKDSTEEFKRNQVLKMFEVWNTPAIVHKPEWSYELPYLASKCRSSQALQERLEQNGF